MPVAFRYFTYFNANWDVTHHEITLDPLDVGIPSDLFTSPGSPHFIMESNKEIIVYLSKEEPEEIEVLQNIGVTWEIFKIKPFLLKLYGLRNGMLEIRVRFQGLDHFLKWRFS